jgi:hypothetical protein
MVIFIGSGSLRAAKENQSGEAAQEWAAFFMSSTEVDVASHLETGGNIVRLRFGKLVTWSDRF